MPLDITVTNPYGNPEKGKLFDNTEQPFMNAEVAGLGDTAYQSLYFANGTVAGQNVVNISNGQWPTTPTQTWLGGIGKVSMATPATGSTLDAYGVTLTSSGGSTPAQATTSLQTRSRRVQFDTGTSTTSTAGIRTTYGQWWRGTTTSEGGFLFNAVFSQNTNVSGHTVFIGLCESTATLTTSAAILTNSIGIGYDTTDSAAGNWYTFRNDGSGTATKVDTGVARNTTSVLEFSAYCKGASGNITVSLINRSTSSVAFSSSSYSTNLPSSNTFLAMKAECCNMSTTSNGGLLLYKMYVVSPE